MLWTGGKDSALALHEIRARGRSIGALVTFAPVRGTFRAHPMRVMRLQAEALQIPHRILRLRPPYREAYQRAFRGLQRAGVRTIVTGDIAEIGPRRNWVRSIAEPMGLEVLQPLWHRSRHRILARLAELGVDAVISYVDTTRLPRTWVGRHLDRAAVRSLEREARRRGADPAGEHGEYHTWVLDAPAFRARLVPTRPSLVSIPTASWIRPGRLALAAKPRARGRARNAGGEPRRGRI